MATHTGVTCLPLQPTLETTPPVWPLLEKAAPVAQRPHRHHRKTDGGCQHPGPPFPTPLSNPFCINKDLQYQTGKENCYEKSV